ncbi:uncharacterized protein LOC124188487 isoform X2 [Daphnia pulex]|uniref:uncharacterized protein LOC124188487 isoform X2 n=1 Tax=Daphnia pulex TaxID=6669 RepID=UPI001EDEEAAF|nr:uncharacterized protein LOC124188487 isoform X2 [Daphnia pulex]
MLVGTITSSVSYCCTSRTERFNAVFLLVLVLGLLHPFAMDAQQTPPNVISEIRDALAGHKELSRVVSYLNLGEKEFLQNLSGTQFTFFAPTNWAFVRVMPMDIADPFYVDSKLRQDVFLHHFVQRSLTKDDLLNNSEIVMADQKPSTLTNSGSKADGAIQINKANINLEPVFLGSNMGVIYIVDRIFATNQQIEEAIRRHPAVETPWGPIDPSQHQGNVNNQDVESQTVVVDLVEEFLREQAAAAVAGQQP